MRQCLDEQLLLRSKGTMHEGDVHPDIASDVAQSGRLAVNRAGSSSRSANVWDNSAMESFFSSLKTERVRRKVYRTRDEARADVIDFIERFYNPKRRHSTIGYVSPAEFERMAELA